jgi:hypothetical protein
LRPYGIDIKQPKAVVQQHADFRLGRPIGEPENPVEQSRCGCRMYVCQRNDQCVPALCSVAVSHQRISEPQRLRGSAHASQSEYPFALRAQVVLSFQGSQSFRVLSGLAEQSSLLKAGLPPALGVLALEQLVEGGSTSREVPQG